MSRILKTYRNENYVIDLKSHGGFYYVVKWSITDEQDGNNGLVTRRTFSDKEIGIKEFYECIGRMEYMGE